MASHGHRLLTVRSSIIDLCNEWPRNGAIVDFGLQAHARYEPLYYGVHDGQITPEQLDATRGRGVDGAGAGGQE